MDGSTTNDVIARAREAAEQGQLWRAKEILQGNIQSRGYDPALFECLGQVLQEMGDSVEAGKYLFLSGSRKPEHEESVSLFVKRYGRGDPLQLYHAFPRQARLESRDSYPAVVASRLAELGLPVNLPAPTSERSKQPGLTGMVVGVGCLLGLMIVLALAVIGAIAVILWFRSAA